MKKWVILFSFGLLVFSAVAQRSYTAGEIQSKTDVSYGRFEVMMYSSNVSGTTSTFFLWKNGGNESSIRWNEIDIETFGKSANQWQSNPIWEYNGSDQNTKRWEEVHSNITVAKAWVKFTLEWTPNYIAWYNNDVQVRRIVKGENVPSSHHRYNNGDSDDPVGYIADPMRMSFNHWATYPGDWLGSWNDADLPSYQFVDWLTYQKWNGTDFDPVSVRYDFNSISEVTSNFNISTHTFTENQCQFSNNGVGVTNGYLWLGIFKTGREAAPTGSQIPPGGTPPVVYEHLLPKKVEAEEFNTQLGMQTETVVASEGTGLNLGYTDAGDYAEYDIEVPTTGDYTVDFRIASLNGNAALSVSIDGVVKISEVAIASTGGWQKWETVQKTMSLEAGKHKLRWTVTKAGFNINWIEFKTVAAPEPPQLHFTNIAHDQTFPYGNALNVNVQATHPSGIATVSLSVGGTMVRQISTAPFNWGSDAQDAALNSLSVGRHTLVASAIASSGEIADTSIDIEIIYSQSVALSEGWNLLSINARVVDSSIATLFNGLDVTEVKTRDAFWRAGQNDGYNSLKTITPGEGYLVKMNTAGALEITGVPLETHNFASLQQNGWQLIGCPFLANTPITNYFNASNCSVIKDFDGYWMPLGTTNTIIELKPGNAYFLKK